MANRFDKMSRLMIIAVTFASFAMSVSQSQTSSTGSDTVAQALTFPTNTENLTLEDIDSLVDQFLEWRQHGNSDSNYFANDLLLFIFERRENDKEKTSIVLLKMYQNNDAESSEFIRQMLNEMFYFDSQVVVRALAEIENHLLEEFRNSKYVDYLINSACMIPQIVTEDGAFNRDALRKDARRIISEIRDLDVDSTVKTKVIDIVETWM